MLILAVLVPLVLIVLVLLIRNSKWYLEKKKGKLREQIRQIDLQIVEVEDEISKMVAGNTRELLTKKFVELVNKKGVLKKQLGEIDQQLRKSFLKRF